MEKLSEELGFLYRKCGSLVLCFDEKDIDKLKELKARGDANGVENVSIITGDEARRLEPSLSEEVAFALYAPTGGIVDPFGLNIALADNAIQNGVEISFDTEVVNVTRSEKGYSISCIPGPPLGPS